LYISCLASDEFKVDIPIDDEQRIGAVCKRFNEQLIFSPCDTHIAYTVRDPVFNATFPPFPARGFANSITIKSRCYDAHLVIDGGMSYIFNDGAKAEFRIFPQDALRTVAFR
uniref:TAXi_C domain-containing protein n=1 Tax=Soboliphyme baturini TaxID=241478 RepID=A0A183J800_9BILA